MNLAPIVKLVRAYDDKEWEIFIAEWQKGLKGYLEVKRLGGAGDMGRDVIGLCDANGCEGIWDNYQAKHYETTLSLPKACEDAGKIIFHAFRKEFSPPRKCVFVAPRGPSTELRDMLLNPTKFRDEVIRTWNTRVATRVVQDENNVLDGELERYVREYDFTTFRYATLDEILDDHRRTAYWASRFGGLLPMPPGGSKPPATIHASESVYIGKLLEVYEELTEATISNAAGLSAFPKYEADLQKQRIRFYDAEAFMAHYRDQTEPGTVEDFADQIFDAVDATIDQADDSHGRLLSALSESAAAQPASVLTPRAKVRVKQGVCHQLANSDRLTWKVQDD